MNTTPTRYQTNPDTATQSVDGEVFVVTSDNRFHNLKDPVAAFLWEALESSALSLEELVEKVVNEFDVNETTATRDVRDFLTEGVAQQLFQQV